MRCAVLVSLAVAAFAAAQQDGPVVSYRNHHLFNVKSDRNVTEFLLREMDTPSIAGMDFWIEPIKDKPSDVHISTPPEGVEAMHALLMSNNAAYSVLDTDIEESFAAQTSGRKGYTRGHLEDFDYFEYHTYPEIIDWMRDIQAEYAAISELVHVGWSYEQREILGLKIFGRALPGKKSVLTNYAIHSREWLSPATGVYMASQILKGYVSDARIRDLVEQVNMTFVFVTNPDGYHTTWTTDRMWRKTRSPNANSQCMGTDPNRNFELAWSEPGASANPCSETYYGTAPFSESETRALSDYLIENGPFHGYIDVHCCGNMWMTPWGYSYTPPSLPDFDYQMIMNVRVTDAIRSVRGTPYAFGPISDVIYRASGSTTDYAYGDLHILYACTTELSGTFTSPPSIIPETVPEVFAGYLAYVTVIAGHDFDPHAPRHVESDPHAPRHVESK